MATAQLGNRIIAALVVIYILLWLIFPPAVPLDAPADAVLTDFLGDVIGEMLAGTAMILMAVGIVLSTRPKRLEPYFGGLDKMYVTHRTVAIAAFLLLIGHFYAIPTGPTPGPGLWIGQFAFFCIVILVLVTVAPRVPLISRFLDLSYHRWRLTHKAMGFLFLLGLIHFTMVVPLSGGTVPGIWMMLISIIGVLAWLYKQLLAPRFTPHLEYTVAEANRINGSIIEVIMKPVGEKLKHAAGQFLFVHFEDDELLKEPHPFTISSAPEEDTLRISVRASGDWTGYLYENLKPGMTAKVEGAHGQFNYKNGTDKQIWVAGGIGITPFTSWMRNLAGGSDKDVNFFYTVRSDGDVIYWDEFEQTAAAHDNFAARKWVSNEDGRLTTEKIAAEIGESLQGYSVYMCGPIKMIEAFAEGFKELGVAPDQIYSEEFNFR